MRYSLVTLPSQRSPIDELDARLIAELRELDWTVEVVDLGEGFPFPSMQAVRQAEMRLAAVRRERPIVVDGLAFAVLPEAAARLCASHPLIALVHHPLACESGLSPHDAQRLQASEQRALASARHVGPDDPVLVVVPAGVA
jgi:hypothetical protein